MAEGERQREASDPQRNEPAGAIRRHQVAELLGGAQEAVIIHNGESYRLRITSRGRLILTK